MEVHGSFGVKFPNEKLDRTRDGLADYCAARWPYSRRKSVANEWDLSADEARSVCEGAASQTTIDKIWDHPRGGWAVALPVLARVIGQPVEAFFQDQMKQAAVQAEKAQRHEALARAAYGRLANSSADPGEDRRTWGRTRKVGSEKARRLAG